MFLFIDYTFLFSKPRMAFQSLQLHSNIYQQLFQNKVGIIVVYMILY